MNCIDNMKTVYGLTDEAFQIPCDPIINAQVGCKMNLIDWAAQMRRVLYNIEHYAKSIPLNNDEEKLKQLQQLHGRMVAARIAVDNIMNPNE